MFSDSTINRTEVIITWEVLMDNEAIQVYGAKRWGDFFRVEMILDNHQIKYQWIDSEYDEKDRAFVSQVNDGCIVIPTILFNNGSILVEPTNIQLRSKLGLELSKSKWLKRHSL